MFLKFYNLVPCTDQIPDKIFPAIASKKEPFAQNFLGAWIRTMTMALGEMAYIALRYGNMDQNSTYEELDLEEEWEIHLAHIIFMAFVFLFTLVVVNLLNAIAIGDVQVRSGTVFRA